LNCEICGVEISYEPRRVVVDGVKLLVCLECAALGTSYWKPASPSTPKHPPSKPVRPPITTKKRQETLIDRGFENVDLVDGWPEKVKRARIRNNLTQEELAKRAKEKLSIIQKIETGKMTPNIQLCRTLEHLLRIKLLVEREDTEVKVKPPSLGELTIGDVVRLKKKSPP